jgi:hypothetical protein
MIIPLKGTNNYLINIKTGEVFLPAVADGNKTILNYYVDTSGNIWSNHFSNLKMLKPSLNSKYPTVSLHSKSFIDYPGSKRSFMVHRVVAETFIPVPKENRVPDEDWESTPESVKKLINLYKKEKARALLVNHIDHDKGNYHPSNLEWVTFKENAAAYWQHKLLNSNN